MLNNTENIEARLCAFVEGDLDEQARAEIEKHLETHPAHRALLDELKRTKAMLLALPREQAPVDMAETLQGHLERSVLLDGVGTEELQSSLKINRFPQLMALAAVLLLAVGLGTLVYFILPAHSSSPATYVLKEKDKIASTQDTIRALSEVEKQKADQARDERELGKVGSKPSDAVAMTPTVASPSADMTISPTGASAPATPTAPMLVGASLNAEGDRKFAATDAMVKTESGATLGASLPPVPVLCVVVSTDSLQTTNTELSNYLTSKNITWSAAGRDVIVQNGSGGGGAGPSSKMQLANAGAAAKEPDFNLQQQMRKSDQYSAVQNSQSFQNSTNSTNRIAVNGGQEPAGQNGGGQNELRQVNQLVDSAKPGPQVIEPTTQPSLDLAASKGENVIIAHNLTRAQAAELSESLGKLYAGQSAVVVDRSRGDVLADKAIAGKDQLIRLTPSQIKEAFNSPTTTQPTNAQPGEAAPTADAKPVATADDNLLAAPAKPSTQPATQPLADDLSLLPQPAMEVPADVMIVVQAIPAAPGVNMADGTMLAPSTMPTTDQTAPAATSPAIPSATDGAAAITPPMVPTTVPAAPATQPDPMLMP